MAKKLTFFDRKKLLEELLIKLNFKLSPKILTTTTGA